MSIGRGWGDGKGDNRLELDFLRSGLCFEFGKCALCDRGRRLLEDECAVLGLRDLLSLSLSCSRDSLDDVCPAALRLRKRPKSFRFASLMIICSIHTQDSMVCGRCRVLVVAPWGGDAPAHARLSRDVVSQHGTNLSPRRQRPISSVKVMFRLFWVDTMRPTDAGAIPVLIACSGRHLNHGCRS